MRHTFFSSPIQQCVRATRSLARTMHTTSAASVRPIVVGVAGPSGSGKTTFANQLTAYLTDHLGLDSVSRLSEDGYYHCQSALPPAERDALNYDHPKTLDHGLMVTHLYDLLRGKAIEKPQYDFATHTRTDFTTPVPSAPVIIVEGILVLTSKELRHNMDLRLFMDVDRDICLARRMLRDIVDRGRTPESVVAQYLESVRPMMCEYVLPSRTHAHYSVERGGKNQKRLAEVGQQIVSEYQARCLAEDSVNTQKLGL